MTTSASLLIAQRGLPQVDLRLPATASPAEEFAAEELRRTLHTIIGCGPQLRSAQRHLASAPAPAIYLNDPDAAQQAGIDPAALSLGREAYHLETREGNLYLLAGGPRGVLYGVYDLLERLGCRWFTPEVSRIPHKPDLELPALDITAAPAFESRDTFNWECHDPLWWVRNRLNGQYTPVPEYMGGNVNYCGFVHTFYSLLPPDEFFDQHPEYFSQVDGQRRRDVAQLCLTNPDVLRIVTQRVLALMAAHPRDTIFSVSQNDCQGACECDACRAVVAEEGAQSGSLLRFVNAVAAETSKAYPDKLIDTLAYQYTLDPPSKVTPHPNVRVRLCSINCCQGHAYGTCDHPESQRFLRALDGWSKRTSQMYIWHYATDFSHYPLPMPDLDELHDNIALYQRYGVHGVFIQGMGEVGGGAESMALRGYVVSRLLWNPQQPVWPIVDEFLSAYYGEAAPFVRRYLDVFHDKVRQDKSIHPSLYDHPTARQFDDDLTLPAEIALEEAERRVHGKQLQRVRLLRGGLRYVRLYRACGTFHRDADIYHGAASPFNLQEFDALVRLWGQTGVQRVREGEAFEFTTQRLRNRLRSHEVTWLQDGEQRLAVVPDLGGRLLEWHVGDRQWLALAEPDSTGSFHPTSGGYSDYVYLGMYRLRGWGEVYKASRQGAKLTLTLDIDRALRLARTLWLSDGKLHILSQVSNRGNGEISLAWGAALHALLPDGVAVLIPSAAGQESLAWESLPQTPAAPLVLTGEQLPADAWQANAVGLALLQRYQGPPLERFSLARSQAGATLSIELRSAAVTLQPGQTLTAQQELWIEEI